MPRRKKWKHLVSNLKSLDISKLRDQVQQNSLSQKVIEAKMDGLKKGMEAKMDGMEAKMDGLKKGVEPKMDGVEAKMVLMPRKSLHQHWGITTRSKP